MASELAANTLILQKYKRFSIMFSKRHSFIQLRSNGILHFRAMLKVPLCLSGGGTMSNEIRLCSRGVAHHFMTGLYRTCRKLSHKHHECQRPRLQRAHNDEYCSNPTSLEQRPDYGNDCNPLREASAPIFLLPCPTQIHPLPQCPVRLKSPLKRLFKVGRLPETIGHVR